MLFGLSTLTLFKASASPELLADVARCADTLGFDSMWMGHHVILKTEDNSVYPYGVNPLNSATPRLDTWVTLAYLSAVTERLRFGSAVYVTPMVNPFLTARAIATADYLSGGRMIVGMGVGWNREEFAMLEQDFANRGARTDEIIDILRKLYSEETIKHEGQFYQFGPVSFEPKPVQRPHPPMLYGGTTPPALARAARLDGCFLPTNDLEQIAQSLETIHRHRQAAGVAESPYDITVAGPFPLTVEAIERYAALGVTRLYIDPAITPFDGNNPFVPITNEAITQNLERIKDAFLF